MTKIANRLNVLREIRERRHVLFSKFNECTTKQIKIEEWNKILQICHSLKLVPSDKKYDYVRDVFWPNIKRSTLAKVSGDQKNGRERNYTEVDKLVLEILGKDTDLEKSEDPLANSKVEPVAAVGILEDEEYVDGHSWSSEETTHVKETKTADVNLKRKNLSYTVVEHTNIEPEKLKRTPIQPTKRKKVNAILATTNAHENAATPVPNTAKTDLDLEFLELRNYKMKLEIVELERKLNIAPSKYALEIIKCDRHSCYNMEVNDVYD